MLRLKIKSITTFVGITLLMLCYQNCGTGFSSEFGTKTSKSIEDNKPNNIPNDSSEDILTFEVVSPIGDQVITLSEGDSKTIQVVWVEGDSSVFFNWVNEDSGESISQEDHFTFDTEDVGTYVIEVKDSSKDLNIKVIVQLSNDVIDPDTDCPKNYIPAPNSDFCISKFEMKRGIDGKASATPEGSPWVNLDRAGSIAACKAIGSGYNLVTNEQWQTIAKNIEAEPSNWSGVGTSRSLNRGHSDGAPNRALAASADDNQACVATGQNCSSTVWNTQKRTHKLSNGEYIWDFAGNVWEWMDHTTDKALGDSAHLSKADGDRRKYYGPTGNYANFGSPYAGLGIGIGVNGPNRAMFRGGHWSFGVDAGIFAFHGKVPTQAGARLGFRCIYK